MKQRGFRQHMTNLSIAWSISNHHWQKIVSNRSILHVGKLLDWIKLHEREKKKKNTYTKNERRKGREIGILVPFVFRRNTPKTLNGPFWWLWPEAPKYKDWILFFSLLFCAKLRNIVILFLRWFFFSPILFERKLWIRSVKCWQNINE